MGDYDFKPSGGLKLKGVKDKKIKKSKKKDKKEKPKDDDDVVAAGDKQEDPPFEVQKTEAEKRFEEIQRQRVLCTHHFQER